MDELPSVDRGPRQSDDLSQTGTGTPRSADDGRQEPGAVGDRDAPADAATAVGGTTSSHPADADETQINRSGSGGSGGPATSEATQSEGSTPASMEELLGGGPEGRVR